MNADAPKHELCPCGSGRRYRRCCGTARRRGLPIPPPAPSASGTAARRPCTLCAASRGDLDVSAGAWKCEAIVSNALAGLCPSCASLPDPEAALVAAIRGAAR